MKQDRRGRMLITQNLKPMIETPPRDPSVIKKRPKKITKKRRYRDNRKLKRAQSMRVERLDDSMYGGTRRRVFKVFPYPDTDPGKSHEIIEGAEGINAAGNMCDCRNGNSPCSHVVAVRLMLEMEERLARQNQKKLA